MQNSDIKNKLMPHEEYAKIEHPRPYFFSIEKNRQYLYYVGATHSYDPKNKQFPLIKGRWLNFLDNTVKENNIVFVEGGERAVEKDEESAIRAGGEASFITYLAVQEKIPAISPEPSETHSSSELLKAGFLKEEIQTYFFARVACQWHRRGAKSDFRKYIEASLERDKKKSGWDDFDFSYENTVRNYEKIIGSKINIEDKDIFCSAANPNPSPERSGMITSKVAKADSLIRNIYIVEQIIKYWNEGKNIFVVYGSSHAVMQEPALRKLLN